MVRIFWIIASLLWAGAASGGLVHGGGVGACSTCHIMHEGKQPGPGGASGSPSLLVDKPSEICLGCHAAADGAVMGGSQLVPPAERGPGNFIFLLEDNLNDAPDGILNPIGGAAAGHNINAPAYGLSADGTRPTAPGGSYPSNRLGCTSCHDPHGNANYRMLRGRGGHQGFMFFNDAPDAEGLDLMPGVTESDAYHISYRGGMSEWCGNCHGDYLNNHADYVSAFEHPTAEQLGSDILIQYNLYNGTADPTGGQESTAYLAAVPFEDAANTIFRTAGPGPTSRLMCLSCHRAHASSAPNAGRWDFNVWALSDDGLVSGSYPIPNPYLVPGQDPLCYKCHRSGSD